MIRLPKEDLPTYILRYPRPVRLARSGLLFLLIGGAGVRWALAWLHHVGLAGHPLGGDHHRPGGRL